MVARSRRSCKVGAGEALLDSLLASYATLTGHVAVVYFALPLLAAAGAVSLVRSSRLLGIGAVAVVAGQIAALCATRPLGEADVLARYFFPVLPILLLLAAAGLVALASAALGLVSRRLLQGAPRGALLTYLGGALGVALGAALALCVPFQSPLLSFQRKISSFRSGKEFLLDAEAVAGRRSRVFRVLRADRERGEVVLVYPEPLGDTAWGDYMRRGLRNVWTRAVSDRARWLRERGVTYRHVLDLASDEELAASGAKYLVVDLAASDDQTLQRMQRRFGQPVAQDDRDALFDLTRTQERLRQR